MRARTALLAALLATAPLLLAPGVSKWPPGLLESSDSHRFVSTPAQWDAVWTTLPEAGTKSITVELLADLSRQGALPLFSLDKSNAAWNNKHIEIHCNRHGFIAEAGSTGNGQPIVAMTSGVPASIVYAECNAYNLEPTLTNVYGLQVSPGNVNSITLAGVHLGNSLAPLEGLRHSFLFSSGGFKFIVRDSDILDFHPLTPPGPWDFQIKSNTIGETSGSGETVFDDLCIGVELGAGDASIQSGDNQYYICSGVRIAGGQFLSAGDYFDGLGYNDGTQSAWEAWFQLGTRAETCTGLDIPYDCCTGSQAGGSCQNAKQTMLDVRSAFFHINQFAGYNKLISSDESVAIHLDGTFLSAGSNNDCFATGLLADGAVLIDTANASTSTVGVLDIQLNFSTDKNGANKGRVCRIGGTTALKNSIFGPNMKTVCELGAAACIGEIRMPGLGQWRVSGKNLYMLAGNFNVVGDGSQTPAQFCDYGHDGQVTDGNVVFVDDTSRACIRAWNRDTGAEVTSCDSAGAMTNLRYYDITCSQGAF